MQETITKILKTSGEKAPLKYVESIEVEEFTMGMVPPRFHFCHARYNPTRNYLQLEADMGFRSSGFQLVVRTSMMHGAACNTDAFLYTYAQAEQVLSTLLFDPCIQWHMAYLD